MSTKPHTTYRGPVPSGPIEEVKGNLPQGLELVESLVGSDSPLIKEMQGVLFGRKVPPSPPSPAVRNPTQEPVVSPAETHSIWGGPSPVQPRTGESGRDR